MSDICEFSEEQTIDGIQYLMCDITGNACYHTWYCNKERKFKMYPEANVCKDKLKFQK